MAKNYKKRSYNKKGSSKHDRQHGRADNRDTVERSNPKAKFDDVIGQENDPKWYTANSRLIADVTKIPFNSQIGLPIEVGPNPEVIIPAIMALDVICAPGIARSNSDGVNIAGQALFQKLRKDLSTYAPYAQADVTMFVLKMVDIYTRYAYIARFFGVVNLWSSMNLAYNDALIESMGYTAEDIPNFRANLNDYRSRFNNLIYKAGSLYMPATFPIVERYMWMMANYFMDHQDPRAQIYLYRPHHFWKLEETGEQGTELVPEYPTYDVRWTMDELLDGFNTAIEEVRNSDSMLKIMGDLRRAFSDAPTWQLDYIDEKFIILPTYSSEVLSQIENTVIMPSSPTINVNITQDVAKNTIIYEPEFDPALMQYYYYGRPFDPLVSIEKLFRNYLINMHWINPSSDDVLVATRNMPTIKIEGEDNDVRIKVSSMGSDMVVACTIYEYDAIAGWTENYNINYLNTVLPTWLKDFLGDALGNSVTGITPEVLNAYLQFDWAPRIMLADMTRENSGTISTNFQSAYPCVESDNYTTIDGKLLERIHNNVIMSMWNVPQLGITYQ